MEKMQTNRVSDPVGACAEAVRILIVDDHPIVRYGIRQLVEQSSDRYIITETDRCNIAWKSLRTNQPEIMLIDIDLQDGCAHKLVARVARACLRTKILVYTANDTEMQITEALRSGAHGFVTKNIEPDALLEAIHAISKNGSYLDPAVASKVIGQLGRKHERRASGGRRLTQRESAVLKAIATGKRNIDIAAELYITERTVKYHLTSMYNKLKVCNRTEAVQYAYKNGLLK
jgi:DNA-binding NarL/FixJ family response regulator